MNAAAPSNPHGDGLRSAPPRPVAGLRRGRLDARTLAPALLAAAVVGAQIAYPLVTGAARDRLTVATVVLFAATSVLHAVLTRGLRFATALVAVTAGGGLAVEALGVSTGLVFGAYAYDGSLGWALGGVPVVIPLAWTMMAYPAFLVGRRIASGPVAGPLVAGAALAVWDLFLDPQMVAAGHWTWGGTGTAAATGPTLLGIPLSNYLGWYVTATVMAALLWRPLAAAERRAGGPIDDRVPVVLYLWTYGSSVLAHLAFFGLPGSALVGGVAMGAVVVAFVRAARR